MLRTAITRAGGFRQYHSVPASRFNIEAGLGGFMSPKTLQTVSQDWQEGLLNRLNDVVRDTELENLSVVQTVINSGTNRQNILAFNLASEALNNSFFLSNLTQSKESQGQEPQGTLVRQLEESYGSVEAFKSAFGATAEGLTGSGYVWLVSDTSRRLGIVSTYGAGTILVRSRQQRGLWNNFSLEKTDSGRSTIEKSGNPLSAPTHTSHVSPAPKSPTQSRKYSTLNQETRNLAETGDVLTPLLCLSVSERCYMNDFGVWGREDYIKQFWKVVDWSKVEEAYSKLIARRVAI
ncbi:manganese and iron superoxide dismutase [Wallemia mellicola]|nr:manganese and iron superoxide dismutase [Wallemia mellicola]